MVPTSVFRRSASFALFKATCPPTRKHLGTKLRLVDPVPSVKRVFDEMTSTQRGLAIESPSEGIERRTSADYLQRKEGRPLLACKQSAMRDQLHRRPASLLVSLPRLRASGS